MDPWSKEQRSKCMSHIHSQDTKPGLIIRKYLYKRGYRYRKNLKRLPGSPDIVLKKYGIVIFVHGCFWHGHDTHFRMPKSNVEFWEKKISRNRQRDEENKEQLKRMGWNVLTVWECQLKPAVREQTLMEIEYYINHSFLQQHRTSKKSEDKAYTVSKSENISIAAEEGEIYGDEN